MAKKWKTEKVSWGTHFCIFSDVLRWRDGKFGGDANQEFATLADALAAITHLGKATVRFRSIGAMGQAIVHHVSIEDRDGVTINEYPGTLEVLDRPSAQGGPSWRPLNHAEVIAEEKAFWASPAAYA